MLWCNCTVRFFIRGSFFGMTLWCKVPSHRAMLCCVVFTLACCEWDWGGAGGWLDVCAHAPHGAHPVSRRPHPAMQVSAALCSRVVCQLYLVLSKPGPKPHFQGVFDTVSNIPTMKKRVGAQRKDEATRSALYLPVGGWGGHVSSTKQSCKSTLQRLMKRLEHLCILINQIGSSTLSFPDLKNSLPVLTFMRTLVSLKQLVKSTPTTRLHKNSSALKVAGVWHLRDWYCGHNCFM